MNEKNSRKRNEPKKPSPAPLQKFTRYELKQIKNIIMLGY